MQQKVREKFYKFEQFSVSTVSFAVDGTKGIKNYLQHIPLFGRLFSSNSPTEMKEFISLPEEYKDLEKLLNQQLHPAFMAMNLFGSLMPGIFEGEKSIQQAVNEAEASRQQDRQRLENLITNQNNFRNECENQIKLIQNEKTDVSKRLDNLTNQISSQNKQTTELKFEITAQSSYAEKVDTCLKEIKDMQNSTKDQGLWIEKLKVDTQTLKTSNATDRKSYEIQAENIQKEFKNALQAAEQSIHQTTDAKILNVYSTLYEINNSVFGADGVRGEVEKLRAETTNKFEQATKDMHELGNRLQAEIEKTAALSSSIADGISILKREFGMLERTVHDVHALLSTSLEAYQTTV